MNKRKALTTALIALSLGINIYKALKEQQEREEAERMDKEVSDALMALADDLTGLKKTVNDMKGKRPKKGGAQYSAGDTEKRLKFLENKTHLLAQSLQRIESEVDEKIGLCGELVDILKEYYSADIVLKERKAERGPT